MEHLDFVDYRLDREEDGIDYRDLCDPKDNFYSRIDSLLSQIVILPSSDLQTIPLISFLLTPSAMSNNLPIGVLYGASGSGKSETAKFIATLHNTPMQTAASTFASIRNLISNSRYYDSDKEFEKNFLLVWDDINEKVFTDSEQMFSMFKSGINRKSVITIADKMGINMEFYPFSPKLVSTVNPFWDNPKLTELKRRLIPFLFSKIQDYSSVEVNLLSVEDINFNGLNSEFEQFWHIQENRTSFNQKKRGLARLKSEIIPLEVFRLYQDNMAACCVLLDIPLKEALTLWEKYFQFINEKIFDTNVGIKRIFEDYIDREENEVLEIMEIQNKLSERIFIKPLTIFDYLDGCYSNGEISQKPDRAIIEGLLVGCGYQKTKTKIGYQWTKTLNL
ncbi:conserved hypothetical protein [Planktothrix sp. PCC 11201]|uniref:hypothetical protein n=1 Tax=Planktothrix sp. PCC 11201 TaxID=1729650 RepID=UPI000915E36C|nr:hypothetical protein [Planktothrix sp. PCC 11201]SKB12040.1 conserved hypothetical protein [Planktothrix sp. PCC 11201]